MRAILDTSVLIATNIAPLDGELGVSAASMAELHFGVLVTSDPAIRAQRLRRLSEFRRRFTPLPIDDLVATSYGQLAAAAVVSGRQTGARMADLLVAATAHAYAARLYTRRADDLAGVQHLVEIVSV